MAKNQIITVVYKGTEVGKMGYDEGQKKSTFQYRREFLEAQSFKNLFPYIIRKSKNAQVFSEFAGETFRGLPPMIADSLPDFFGNIVFKEWLETNHKELNKITPLEQLTYVGNRGMGALEYLPAIYVPSGSTIDIQEMAEVVQKILDLKSTIEEKDLSDKALLNIFKIGTSAGGVRPKILVSEHKKTGRLIPGDLKISDDYHHYIIKLSIDDVLYSKEKIEFIYYQLATSLGIEMMPSKLINNKHFATLRFDRQDGEKQHILTAAGMTGWDFQSSENSNYENLFKLSLDLNLPHKEIQMLYKRMIFNVVFANVDDHLKNFSFIYSDTHNKWNLAPAYDLTYSLDALKNFLRISRAMSINGKRNDINLSDVLNIADMFTIKDAKGIIKETVATTQQFSLLCIEQEIPQKVIQAIQKEFNLLGE